jgi:hypothetical protein
MSIDKELAPFLRNLADLLDSNRLKQDQIQKIGEFYMLYNMTTELINTGDSVGDSLSDIDAMKFIVLGWFIYKNIVKNES